MTALIAAPTRKHEHSRYRERTHESLALFPWPEFPRTTVCLTVDQGADRQRLPRVSPVRGYARLCFGSGPTGFHFGDDSGFGSRAHFWPGSVIVSLSLLF